MKNLSKLCVAMLTMGLLSSVAYASASSYTVTFTSDPTEGNLSRAYNDSMSLYDYTGGEDLLNLGNSDFAGHETSSSGSANLIVGHQYKINLQRYWSDKGSNVGKGSTAACDLVFTLEQMQVQDASTLDSNGGSGADLCADTVLSVGSSSLTIYVPSNGSNTESGTVSLEAKTNNN
tara:strand:- start:53659 stop:54186 length:528 start_codon:yes stop_codon:yes gene_type:complete